MYAVDSSEALQRCNPVLSLRKTVPGCHTVGGGNEVVREARCCLGGSGGMPPSEFLGKLGTLR